MSQHRRLPEFPILLVGNFPFSRPGRAVSICLHLRGGGCSGTAWLPANPPLSVLLGVFLAGQGGCALLWGGDAPSSCNLENLKSSLACACCHPVWAEPCRWAQGTRWGAQPCPAELGCSSSSPVSILPLWSISPPPPAAASSSPPLTSTPMLLGVIQVLFSLRKCDANVLQEPSTGLILPWLKPRH